MLSSRTRFLAIVAMLPLAVGLSACSGGAANQAAGGTEDTPIRVALISDSSGPYAEFASQQKAGVEFAAKEINAKGGVDGHKVELYKADSLGTSEGAVAAAQRLVQQKQAMFITGTVATPATLAVMQRLSSWGALEFGAQSQGVDLTGKSCVPNFFRVDMNDNEAIAAMASWLDKRDAIKDWDAIGADYEFGRGSVDGLNKVVTSQNGTVKTKVFAPLGSTDYGSYASQLKGGGGLLIANSGGDSINFLKQALQFGTLKKYGLVFGNAAFTDSSLAAVNDEGLVGAWGTANWISSVDNPQSAAFVAAYTKETGNPPADFTGAAYMAMQTLFAGVEKAKSVDPMKVKTALEGLTFDSIKGEVTVRAADHQIQAPIYIGEVEKGEKGLKWTSKEAIPASENDSGANPECKL